MDKSTEDALITWAADTVQTMRSVGVRSYKICQEYEPGKVGHHAVVIYNKLDPEKPGMVEIELYEHSESGSRTTDRPIRLLRLSADSQVLSNARSPMKIRFGPKYEIVDAPIERMGSLVVEVGGRSVARLHAGRTDALDALVQDANKGASLPTYSGSYGTGRYDATFSPDEDEDLTTEEIIEELARNPKTLQTLDMIERAVRQSSPIADDVSRGPYIVGGMETSSIPHVRDDKLTDDDDDGRGGSR